MTLAPGDRLGSYEILALLGAGGMGEVYLARDTTLDRKVALKILPADVAHDATRMQRFVREAKAASALNHPSILTIHEIGTSDAARFIATEYVEGDTLRARMAGRRLTTNEVLEIGVQVAGALAVAHEAGIIHRDIKPENIMIRRDGLAKVLDFGLARSIGAPESTGDPEAPTRADFRTEPGAVVGTVAYMSPEQARGLELDAGTDIFSLGVVLYELIAGRLPADGSSSHEIVASTLSDRAPQPLARYARDVPDELERIVSKALRKDRSRRYHTARDLMLDLQSLKQHLEFHARLDGAVPSVAAPTPATREVVAPRAVWWWVALAGVALAVAIVGVGVFQRTAPAAVTIDSIAVLPFVNQNQDQEVEYLSDGLTESIINNLTQLAGLRVTARNSAFTYKGQAIDQIAAGKKLGVRAVVVGRVLQRGQDLVVGAELVDVQDNKQLWGQQYRRRLSDVFEIQEEIAKEISETLRVALTGAERQQLAKHPTQNIKAFQYYMQGRSFAQRRSREDLMTAISYCEKAIAEDADYALAYAGLTEAYSVLGARSYIPPGEGRKKAQEFAQKAVALDDHLAEAHLALSQPMLLFAPYDFASADRELTRALALSPSLAMAHNYRGISFTRQGRWDEAFDEYEKARELDPLSPVIARGVALPTLFRRDAVRAHDLLKQAQELGPTFVIPFEVGIYIQNGLLDEALADLGKARQQRPNDPILIYSTGLVYASQGKRTDALAAIKQLEDMSGATLSQAHWIAQIYSALNEKDQALTWLERGFAVGSIGDLFKGEPVWDPIRTEPRFAKLLAAMNVP